MIIRHKTFDRCFVILLSALLYCGSCLADEAVLLDTRTAISDLGWIIPTGSEWQEMTSSDGSGNQHRMLMVCQITAPGQDNWLRSHYIPIQGARRVYVEIEFTIRSCEDVENVASCKETFNLFYYQTDRDEATSTFPPWNGDAYTKVDTIAADQRFEPGSAKTNFEIRDIGPLSKKGIYLAVQDTGACVALMHIRAYYMYCPEVLSSLASFPRTTSGAEVTTLVQAKGNCVAHASEGGGKPPSLYCNGKGSWTVPSGSCVCESGYSPDESRTRCNACSSGWYKSTSSNQLCKRCPDYSLSSRSGAASCECMKGYYRSSLDSPELPCTKPPSKPLNLLTSLNGTYLQLYWEQPISTGGRSDLLYRVFCSSCQPGFINCVNCDEYLQYTPSNYDLNDEFVEIFPLSHYAYYKFKVCATNGVSAVAASSGKRLNNCVETIVETSQSGTSAVTNIEILERTNTSFSVSWAPPHNTNAPVLDYEITVYADMALQSTNQNLATRRRTKEPKIRISGLQPATRYIVRVRPQTVNEFGPYSVPLRVTTKSNSAAPPADHKNEDSHQMNGHKTQIIIAIVAGLSLVILIVFIAIMYKRHQKKRFDSSRNIVEMKNSNCNGNVGLLPIVNASYKTYVDPSLFNDPHKAVMEFAKEIDRSNVKIEQLIGEGEFSDVYKGQLLNPTGRLVAVKTLKEGSNPDQKLDFLGEASIMGQFDHPNVIRLEGVVTRSRPFMIITEYVENGSLDEFLKKHYGELNVLALVGMLRHIAAGMKYLADMGYVHRDLAARNVLVDAKMVCKVSDFGLSRVLEEDTEAAYATRGEKIPIRWTAPEAIMYRKFTSASDVWSFGIVMWEVMSYGEIPYWGMSNREVMNAVESGNRLPTPVRCPQTVHELMLECWKKDRNQRPTFAQLVKSLANLTRESWKLQVPTQDRRTPRPESLSSTPVGATDSGINEDSDEDSPMLLNSKTEESLKPSFALADWLRAINMDQYLDSLIKNGCTSLEQLRHLNSNDLTKMGIMVENHQEALLSSIPDLHRNPDQQTRDSPPALPV